MQIRQETPQDFIEVYHLIKTAFDNAEHRDGTEQDLVVLLRKRPAFRPELSLVAEENGVLYGYLLFTEVQIGSRTALALAPLAVLPCAQKQGIGQALMEYGHRIAKSLGYQMCIVLGSETYYPKAGYVPASRFGIRCPFDDVPDANFMALPLTPTQADWNGVVVYDNAFTAVSLLQPDTQAHAFTHFLHTNIPLTAAMEIQTLIYGKEKVVLSVPLAPNQNDKHTGFGGSISCLATVCGWSVMYANFHDLLPEGKIVVQKSEMQYFTPITDDFRAECICPTESERQHLLQSYQMRGKGKTTLQIHCYCQDTLAASMQSTYFITQP